MWNGNGNAKCGMRDVACGMWGMGMNPSAVLGTGDVVARCGESRGVVGCGVVGCEVWWGVSAKCGFGILDIRISGAYISFFVSSNTFVDYVNSQVMNGGFPAVYHKIARNTLHV